MLHRLHLLCAAPIAGWIAGVFSSAYVGDAHLGVGAYAFILGAGAVVGPLIGVSAMRALPELFDWEDNHPRDFFLPALASSAMLCLLAGMILTSALGT